MVQQSSLRGLDLLVVNHTQIMERQLIGNSVSEARKDSMIKYARKQHRISRIDYVAEWNLLDEEDKKYPD
jgi:hypothetical protein